MRPVARSRITNRYGVKNRLYAAGVHTGTDFASVVPGRNFTGTAVRAVDDGVVVRFETNDENFGRWVVIRGVDARGSYVAAYCHLSSTVPGLRVGTRVRRGQFIGRVGSTGNSSAPHLHYQENPGRAFLYSAHRRPVHCYGRTWGTILKIRARRKAAKARRK